MELLRFFDSKGSSVPMVFENAFAPSLRFLFADADSANCNSTALRLPHLAIPLANNTFHVRFLLDDILPGSCELEQVHSGIVVEESVAGPAVAGDGLYAVCTEGEVVRTLAIRTADCLAVALSAQVDGVRYGALVHAGWRGFAEGIHIRAINLLADAAKHHGVEKQKLLDSLSVLVGPAIFGASYECGVEVHLGLTAHYKQHFAACPLFSQYRGVVETCLNVSGAGVERLGASLYLSQKFYPDLQLLMACDCLMLGVKQGNIQILRENTWNSPILYSYRHATVHGRTEGRRLHTHLLFSPQK